MDSWRKAAESIKSKAGKAGAGILDAVERVKDQRLASDGWGEDEAAGGQVRSPPPRSSGRFETAEGITPPQSPCTPNVPVSGGAGNSATRAPTPQSRVPLNQQSREELLDTAVRSLQRLKILKGHNDELGARLRAATEVNTNIYASHAHSPPCASFENLAEEGPTADFFSSRLGVLILLLTHTVATILLA